MASVATHTFISGTYGITQTFSLPSLTTTFTPPSSCNSYLLYSTSLSLPPQKLEAWDYVDSTTAVVLVQDCWPQSLPNIYARGQGWDDISSLAFPGTACMKGWTTACTTSFDYSGTSFTQTLCCPSEYTCAPIEWLRDRGTSSGLRFCAGFLSTSTNVWMFDPERGSLKTTALSAADNFVYPIYRYALPLAGVEAEATSSPDVGTASSTALLSTTSTLTQPAYASPVSGSSGMSSGAIAGIAVSCTAIAFTALGVVAFFLLRPRLRRSKLGASLTAQDSGGPAELKSELDASQSVGQAVASPTTARNDVHELYGSYGGKAELEARDRE